MAKKPAPKGEPRVKKLLLPIPEELHHRLKVYAVQNNIYMRDFVLELIAEALEKRGGESKKK